MQDPSDFYLAIDIGASTAKLALAKADGTLSHQTRFQTGTEITNQIFLERLENAILQLGIDQHSSICAAGIGCPSPIDNQTGYLLFTNNMPNLRNLPLGPFLMEKFNLKSRLENDANAAALGEYKFGHLNKYESVVFLTLGTGIGGGFIHNGKLLTGSRGNSMEIGHITVVPEGLKCGCSSRGCLEMYSGFKGIYQRLLMLLQDGALGGGITAIDGAAAQAPAIPYDLKAILADDSLRPLVQPLLKEAGYYLGIAVATVIELLAPQAVVLTGGLAGAWDLFEAAFKQSLEDSAHPITAQDTEIIIRREGEPSGLLGALALALSLDD